MKVYLAGLVPKGDKEKTGYHDWRKEFIEWLSLVVEAEFIDPRDRPKNFNEADIEAVFGLDCKKIKECDLLIVNGDGLGIGGSQEILIAKYFQKRVVVVLPRNSTHRRSNLEFNGNTVEDWIHPFIYCTCDLLIENIEDLTKEKLRQVMSSEPKGLELIDDAISSLK